MRGISKHTQTLLAALMAALLVLYPAIASAKTSEELQEELIEVQQELSDLEGQIASLGETLNDTIYQLEETEKKIEVVEGEIADIQAELAEDQEILGNRISDSYKAGQTTLLDVILDARSFEELSNNIYYQNRMNEHDVQVINRVNATNDDLEAKRAELESLRAEQEELKAAQEVQLEELKAAEEERTAYAESLTEEIKEKIEEERLAELAEQQAEAERLMEELGYSFTGSIPGAERLSATRQIILTAAYSQIGVPYVWADATPGVGLDCSGLTSWAYSQAGVYIPHSAGAQASMATVTTDPQPGDLVFWIGGMNPITGNHVAIYLGGGLILHEVPPYCMISPIDTFGSYTFIGSIL